MENILGLWRHGQLSCATNMAWTHGLSIQTRTWRKLVQAVEFGPRQSINCVGGISVKPLEDDLKEIYLLQHTTPSAPIVNTHSSTSASSRPAAWTQMTLREVFLGRYPNKGSRGGTQTCQRSSAKTQILLKFEFPFHTSPIPAKLFRP
jgi:hypothetical protein